MKKNDNLNIIELFLEMLYAENGLSKNTILSYQSDLKLFLNFIQLKQCDLLNVEEQDIKSYLNKLYEEKISPSSVSRKISTIKRFFKFLELDGYKKENPTTNIIRPKNNEKLPKVLSEKEVFKLLDFVNKDKSDFGIRLSCMMEILYASGLRVSELVSLPISATHKDTSFEGKYKNYLLVRGKGGKERIAPLNKSALNILSEYIELRKKMGHKQSKWLFCGHVRINKDSKDKKTSHNKFADTHITRQRFHQMLKELAFKAGVDPKKVSPHVVRHSFASHLLNNGVDLRVLQELLGHSDISTTQIYTHILDSKLKDLVNNYHPLSKNIN